MNDFDEFGDFFGFTRESVNTCFPTRIVLQKVISIIADYIKCNAESQDESMHGDIAVNRNCEPQRYPRRNVKRINYREEEVPDHDDYIYCDLCHAEWEGDCPHHGALTIIHDAQVPSVSKGLQRDPHYAMRTIPHSLKIELSGIRGAGLGVWTKEKLSQGLRFGPYGGVKTSRPYKRGYGWEIKRESRVICYVDAHDPATSNWMRYVNCARYEEEQNLVAFQFKGEMYYRTTQDIMEGVELLVWYGDEYGRELGIDVPSFRKSAKSKGKRKSSTRVALESEETSIGGSAKCSDNSKGPENNKNKDKIKIMYEEKKVYSKCEEKGKESLSLVKILRQFRIFSKPAHDRSGDENNKTLESEKDSLSERKEEDFKTFNCHECGDKFQLKKDLRRHMKVHFPMDVYECDDCGEEFDDKAELSAHWWGIHYKKRRGSERGGQCLDDGKGASGNRGHSNENGRHDLANSGSGGFHCDYCKKGFKCKSHLNVHIRTHTGEKPFQCQRCPMRSNTMSDLNVHIRTHTGEKPYKCQRCPMRFTTMSNLNVHIRTHTGEKPYKCQRCPMRFTTMSNLNVHIRTHTGEKPYKCETCSKTFTQLSNLKVHRLTHTL